MGRSSSAGGRTRTRGSACWSSCAVSLALTLAAAPAPAVELVEVGRFDSPTYVTAPPGDDQRLFVVERAGRIRIYEGGGVRSTPFLDITDRVSVGGERGLLSMAFAPDYAASGRFFVYYTDDGGDVTVAELHRSAADPARADPGTLRVLLRQEHSARSNHNGGQLQFGPDGRLYAALGDGAVDPQDSQRSGTFAGKMVRFDASGTPSEYARGLRNPYRFSFDRATGDLVIGDVGGSYQEEVDFRPAGSPAGANFGWPACEGDRCTEPAPPNYVEPVLVRPRNPNGCTSITGGYVVRDAGLPDLLGRYIYGDFCSGTLRSAVLSAEGSSGDGPVGVSVPSLVTFGEDAAGCVYAASLDGPVYRLATSAGADPGPCPLGRGPATPDPGERLAFVRDRRVWSLSASGDATRLTGASGAAPTFSPDGGRIAFQRRGQIWAMASVDPQSAERLTGGGGSDPAFSPDGSRIAFVRDRQIFAMGSVDPQRAEQLTGGGGDAPAFSPDGTRIAFERRGQIWVMDSTDPERAERLTGGGGSRPVFSPDGSRIAFVRDGQIWAMASVDPKRANRLTGGGGDHPTFSSDGQRIAFERSGQIYRMASADPKRAVPLTVGGGEQPAYAP